MQNKITIGYGKKILYQDVDVPLAQQGIISFIGDNGSGKSTFYKTLMGIIPPISGSISRSISDKMAIVSDYIHIPEEVTVADILNLLGTEKVVETKEKYEKIHNYIMQYERQFIKTLSSGQKRILEIYAVLASGKSIIILDEAANSLDFKNRRLFLAQVRELANDNILFLHTSHDFEDVVYLGGDIYGLFKNTKDIKRYTGEYAVEKLRDFLYCGENI